MSAQDPVQHIELLTSTDDDYGGVIVEIVDPIDSTTFLSILRASISHWKHLVYATYSLVLNILIVYSSGICYYLPLLI